MKTKIFIAGHRGLVGSALHRLYSQHESYEVLTRTRAELDLTDSLAVKAFYKEQRPDQVIVAAAKVGGIKANWEYPVDFLLYNLKIQNNLIEGAYEAGVKKLLFLGSSCIYPKHAPQPMREDSLLTGPLEVTNEPYAIAKITGIRLCQAYRRQYGADFICAMPTNLYGPNDNFNLETSHVLPALVRRFHEAKKADKHEILLWGTGVARREFLHSDDLAKACLLLMEQYDQESIINIGCGKDLSIRELATTISEIVGYEGTISWDSTKPDGTPRKLLEISKIQALGWHAQIPLKEGIRSVYEAFAQAHP